MVILQILRIFEYIGKMGLVQQHGNGKMGLVQQHGKVKQRLKNWICLVYKDLVRFWGVKKDGKMRTKDGWQGQIG